MAINTAPEIHSLVICANIFVKRDGKYLLLRRSEQKKYAPGFVHPIGGKIEVNEDPLEGAKRELMEEAGITVKNIRLEAVLTEIQPVKGESENWLIFHFSGDYDSGEMLTTEEGILEWFTPEQIVEEKLFPSVEKVIEHVLDHQAGTVFATFVYDQTEGGIRVKSMNVCSLA
jgi:8-oxo-dGTP pyrophosphatase MutT (NUDIX family)